MEGSNGPESPQGIEAKPSQSTAFEYLFLDLDYPIGGRDQRQKARTARDQILAEFNRLDENKKQELLTIFKRYFCDPGLAREILLKKDDVEKIRQLNGEFKEEKGQEKLIFNRRSILRVAANEILAGKKVAFVNFDIKDLRLADKVGFAEIILRDFADALQQVAIMSDYRSLRLIPARTGGDEFCFFTSSDEVINQEILKSVYEKVSELFAQKTGYYLTNEEIGKIEKRSAVIKSFQEENPLVISNRPADRAKNLARAISTGRVPENNQPARGTNVSNEEYRQAKTRLEKRYHLELNRSEDELKKTIGGFLKQHPEYEEEINSLSGLISDGHLNLANYFYAVLEGYQIDSLFDLPIHTFADFLRHLKARKKDERLTYLYFPCLKNLNADLGHNQTDDEIIRLFHVLEKLLGLSDDQIKQYMVGRQGGDFVLPVAGYYKLNEELSLSPEQMAQIAKLHPGIEVKKLPYFILTIDPKILADDDIGQIIENIKNLGRTNYVIWLNQLFEDSPRKAEQYLKYYLIQRTEDRKKSLLAVLNKLKNPNAMFLSLLSAKDEERSVEQPDQADLDDQQ